MVSVLVVYRLCGLMRMELFFDVCHANHILLFFLAVVSLSVSPIFCFCLLLPSGRMYRLVCVKFRFSLFSKYFDWCCVKLLSVGHVL